MAGSDPHHAKSQGSQCEDHFQRLERERDLEGNVHTVHTDMSYSRDGSRIPHEDDAKAMQREIDHLKKSLRRARRRQTPYLSNPSFEGSQGSSYRPRSKISPSDTFSYEKDDLLGRRDKKSSSRGLGNDAMSQVLYQITKSPFSRKIEKGKLPRRFTQPMFTIYNGRIDLVEHVEERFCWAVWFSPSSSSQHRIPRTGTPVVGEDPEGTVLQMAQQDGWRPYEAESESHLSISSGHGSYYRELRDAMEPFGAVGSGKFLGYMVTHRGIEVNSAQVKAINSLQPPQNPKEVQKLMGMTTTLNRFISRSADRCRTFFQLLNKWKGFEWIRECALAFQQLKKYLSQPPIMSRPEVDEILFAYIAVAIHAVSLVLIRDDSGIQRPVYYVSKSLYEAEVRYLPLEKAILAVVHATRKLPHYFQSHTIVVLTQLPLKSVLADLVAEFAEPSLEENAKGLHMDGKSVGMISFRELLVWKVYIDGVANQRGSGVGLVLKIGGKSVQMLLDSQLVVGQVMGTLEARDPRMQEYLTSVRCLQSKLDSFTLMHISRSGNTHADSLATLATSSAQGLPRVILVEDLLKPARTASGAVHIHQVRFGPSWMDLIISFLKNDVLPEERSEADKVRRKAPRFWLSEDQKLYKRSFSGPYLLCIHPKAKESLLEELHEGICGSIQEEGL
ncbi:uncharacterized protein LOC142605859 [Castanea sativa]|uniref:uncharacterized protein LOC142605859 n=1 Tax=Castanea sativa TaxID=21020 RepID=UPI003F65335B